MEKLYETQSMLGQLEAVVSSCTKDSEGIKITLDKSIFFPEGGGQYADRGELLIGEPQGERVVHLLDGREVKCETGRRVEYLVDSWVEPGTEVLCKLDWKLRFSRMQQHSGEHVLTGLVHGTFGYNNTSFHLSDDEPVTVCFSGSLNEKQIEEIEYKANQIIYKNLSIIDTYPTKEELSTLTYRSKIEIEGQVRIISIEGVDICACCAPHVPSTAYIGIIKVISSQSYKGGTQLNILCGSRAFEYLRDEHRMVTALSHDFSTSIDKLPVIVAQQRERLAMTENELAGIKEAGYLRLIDELGEDAAPVFFAENMSAHAMKICYNALTKKYKKFCGVFNGNDAEGYRFYAGNPALDSNLCAKRMRDVLFATGGGSKEMIQGKLSKTAEEITDFFGQEVMDG